MKEGPVIVYYESTSTIYAVVNGIWLSENKFVISDYSFSKNFSPGGNDYIDEFTLFFIRGKILSLEEMFNWQSLVSHPFVIQTDSGSVEEFFKGLLSEDKQNAILSEDKLSYLKY